MRLGQIGFSCWELIFVPSSTQYSALIIFSFLLSTCNRNTYYNTTVCVRREVVIEQTRFLSAVFLENIYSEVNFCGKNVCGNFYLRELVFADRWKKTQKLEPAKISCHTVVCQSFCYRLNLIPIYSNYLKSPKI